MVQHVAYSIIAAPLLLIGTPTWLARWLLSPRWLLATVRCASRLVPATILFNLVVIVTHTPIVVNAALEHALLHFAIHTLDLRLGDHRVDAAAEPAAGGPAAPAARADAVPVPAVDRADDSRVVPDVRRAPALPFYDHVPRLWGISAISDMQVAGVIMKIGVGFTLWVIIAILFFRWYSAEEAPTPSRRVSRDLDRELMGLRQP